MHTHTPRRTVPVLVGLAVVITAAAAHARPSYTANCAMSGCHAQAREASTVVGQDVEEGGPAGLKIFQVVAGETSLLSVDVNDNWGGTYGVAIRDGNDGNINTDVQGELTPANTLLFTPDAAWDPVGDAYTVPAVSAVGTWTFDMTVDANVAADFYLLEFIVAGKGGGRWSDRETFYLQVMAAASPGDADGDGDVDLDDFVILKQNFGTPAGATGAEGDFDGDSDVDLDDFVILKQNFGTAAVPEPVTISLLASGGVVLLRRPCSRRSRL